MKSRAPAGHALALFSILVWGSTFTSTKLLLEAGLHPLEIMVYRFALAYVALWLLHPRFYKPISIAHELSGLLAGVTGVTAYFVLENLALAHTTVSNTSLLVAVAPLFTGLLAALFFRAKLKITFFAGFVVAISGVFLILFNGGSLRWHPLGDGLALAAALCWAAYTLCAGRLLDGKMNVLAATRRMFFYGLIAFIPVSFIFKVEYHPLMLLKVNNAAHILFLGLIASALCYITWNKAVAILGPIPTNMYIYLNPLTALLTAFAFLGEKLSPLSWMGAALIITGLAVSNLTTGNGKARKRS